MSTLLHPNPQELRPLLHERIDQLTEDELEAVRTMLLELEAKRRLDETRRGFEADWQSGKITDEKIAEAIREHRAGHPYR